MEDLLFDLSATGHLLMALKAQSGMTQANAQVSHSLAPGDLLPSDHQLLVNLATHIRLYQPDTEAATTVLDTGVTIALQILGQDIFRHLYADKTERLLRIILPEPNASPASATMADLLSRIPWEIARPSRSEPSLFGRNLRVCIVPATSTPAPAHAPLGKTLRILFIHAEAPGSIPLALRQERRALQALFRDHIEPDRKVEAHFLAHGVTREHIAEQIRRHGGYHIIHWSGHGQHNLLELATADGSPDHISGAELLALLHQEASILPRLCFLSACDSASSAAIHNWGDFLAAPDTAAVDDATSLTSTAHTLYAGGVASVIAMRFPVGDAYARELALAFYARLLAGKDAPGVAGALQQARRQCSGTTPFGPCDHAAPVLFGAEQTDLRAKPRRKPLPRAHAKYLPATGEWVPHPHFVGRSREMAAIGHNLMHDAATQTTLQITGIGGMGKTTLAAEVMDAWQDRFDWILPVQAKPHPITLEAWLRQIHLQLNATLGPYYRHCQKYPQHAIWREPGAQQRPDPNHPTPQQNLLRALHVEAILLVLDNFETQLCPQPQPGGQVWACQEAAWDAFLAGLIPALAGSRSRLLLTSRRPLAALAEPAAAAVTHALPLGPLAANEARLYLVQHPHLLEMLQQQDASSTTASAHDSGPQLALRLLHASRFHPLLMDRLARLATPAYQPQLLQVLAHLEAHSSGLALPALFADAMDGSARQQEQAYLQDALTDSIDFLLQSAGADARRLLWVIALANEPIESGLLFGAWYGESMERQNLRELRQLLANFDQLDPELQARIKALPAEMHDEMAQLPPPPVRPALLPLLDHLTRIGLIQQHEQESKPGQEPKPGQGGERYTCHELVRERSLLWMADYPEECAELSPEQVWQAFMERLLAAFDDQQYLDLAQALQLGARGLVYCVQIHDFDLLASYANVMVTATTDPQYLAMLLPYLYEVVDKVPPGRACWLCLATLGDALCRNEESAQSIGFYQEACTQAQAAAEAGGTDAHKAWGDLAAIYNNLAIALRDLGQLEAARLALTDCIEAGKRAGSNPCELLSGEVELLRLTLLQDIDIPPEAMQTLADYRATVANWWQQWLNVLPFDRPLPDPTRPPVPDAPDREVLARLYINLLDAISDAHFARQDWPQALEVIDAVLAVKRQLQRPQDNITGSRMDRANVLRNLGQLSAAKTELEACYDLYADNPLGQLRVVSSLGRVWFEMGDVQQAILQEQRVLAWHTWLADPVERAISHNNMANYLAKVDKPAARKQSSYHLLAALVYRWVAELHQHCQITLDEYALQWRRAGKKPVFVPRLADLLQQSAFAELAQWLQARRPDREALQIELDVILEVTRARANANGNTVKIPFR